jgi:ankyrin repeat protein
VQLLLEKLPKGKDRQLLLNTSLVSAARAGHAESVQTLLAQGAAVNFADDRGDTALLVASLSGDLKSVELLLAKGGDVRARNNEGRTALMKAVEHRREGIEAIEQPNQYYDIVKLLIAKGADFNALDKTGITALKLAQLNSSSDLVKLLREAGAK